MQSQSNANELIIFKKNLKLWNEKNSLANQYLLEAKSALKNGDKVVGCRKQIIASDLGLEATESLMKAFEAIGTEEDSIALSNNLKEWKELRHFCSVI